MDRRLGNRFDLEKDHSNHRRNDPIRHNGHFETVSSFGASTSNDQSRMHRPYTRDIGQEGYQPAQQYSSKSFVGSSPQWERAKSINDLPPPPHRMPPPTNFRQLTSAILQNLRVRLLVKAGGRLERQDQLDYTYRAGKNRPNYTINQNMRLSAIPATIQMKYRTN